MTLTITIFLVTIIIAASIVFIFSYYSVVLNAKRREIENQRKIITDLSIQVDTIKNSLQVANDEEIRINASITDRQAKLIFIQQAASFSDEEIIQSNNLARKENIRLRLENENLEKAISNTQFNLNWLQNTFKGKQENLENLDLLVKNSEQIVLQTKKQIYQAKSELEKLEKEKEIENQNRKSLRTREKNLISKITEYEDKVDFLKNEIITEANKSPNTWIGFTKMNGDEKIDSLLHIIAKEFERNLAELTSICESHIEKYFLLHLCYYFYRKSNESWKVDFSTERIASDYSEAESPGIIIKYRNQKRYAIVPQYRLEPYRLDFAVFIYSDQKVSKFCIECDGFEFHKTKEQIQADNERTRILAKNGWITFRYTGTELFNWDNNSVEDFKETLSQFLIKSS